MQLEELKNVNLELKELAINTVKYQNFKTKSAIDKLGSNLKESTKRNYFEFGIRYIKTGIKNKTISKKFYNYIDNALSIHIQPLTPNLEDKRQTHKNTYTKKNVILPVTKIVNELTQEPLTEKFIYGVKYSDHDVKILNSKHDALMFLNGIKSVGKQGRLVSIQDIKED